MALDLTAYNDELARNAAFGCTRTLSGLAANACATYWNGSYPGSAGRVCDASVDGGQIPADAVLPYRLGRLAARYNGNSTTFWVLDRLVDVSGLAANSTLLQTVSHPTLPVARGQLGVLVYAYVEGVLSATGSPLCNLMINYTDDTGAGKTSVTSLAAGWCTAGRASLVNLAAGGRGMRAITGATLDGAASTAGEWALVLARVLAFHAHTGTVPAQQPLGDDQINGFRGALTPIPANACPYFLGPITGTTAGAFNYDYSLIKGQY